MLLKWNEYVVGGKAQRPTLELLGDWLQKQAEAHELLPVKPKGGGRMDDRRQPPPKDRRRDHPFRSFAGHDGTSSESCPIDKHLVPNCKRFNEMSPDDRAEAAKETMLCFSCLKGGHRSRECPESKVDNCKKKHHNLLQVVPVILHGPAKSCGTYVMLDLGSTYSLIQSSLADKLGLDGP